MALIQLNVPDEVKDRADRAFARSGLTTPYAMRIMVNQVAQTGRTPFDGLFSSPSGYAAAFSRWSIQIAASGVSIYGYTAERCACGIRGPWPGEKS